MFTWEKWHPPREWVLKATAAKYLFDNPNVQAIQALLNSVLKACILVKSFIKISQTYPFKENSLSPCGETRDLIKANAKDDKRNVPCIVTQLLSKPQEFCTVFWLSSLMTNAKFLYCGYPLGSGTLESYSLKKLCLIYDNYC